MKQLLSLVLLFAAASLWGQNPFKEEISQTKNTIDSLIATENMQMYKSERAVASLLKEKKITKEQSKQMIEMIRQTKERNTQQHFYKENLKLAALLQQKAAEKPVDTLPSSSIDSLLAAMGLKDSYEQKIQSMEPSHKKFSEEKRKTDFNIAFALGMRAAVNGKGVFNPSTSVEIAAILDTPLRKSNSLSLQYGLVFLSDRLAIKGDHYFTLDNQVPKLTPYPHSLEVSRLRTDYLTLYAGLQREFASEIRVGAGGYFGFLTLADQKIKYKEGKDRYEVLHKHDIKANPITYGLSAHIGYGALALYVKYNFAPLFKNTPNDIQTFVVGLKLW